MASSQGGLSITKSFFFLIIIIIFILLNSSIFSFITSYLPFTTNMTYLTGITNLYSIGIVLFVLYSNAKQKYAGSFPFHKIELLHYPAIICTAVGMSMLLSDVDNLFRSVFPMPQFIYRAFSELLQNEDVFSSIFTLVLVAPLSEELLFRGFLLQNYRKRFSVLTSIFISSCMFSLFHLNPWQMIGAFVMGLYLGWIVSQTGSLTASVCAHAVANGFPLLIVQCVTCEISGFTTPPLGPVVFQPWWFDLAGGALCALGIAVHFSVFRNSKASASLS